MKIILSIFIVITFSNAQELLTSFDITGDASLFTGPPPEVLSSSTKYSMLFARPNGDKFDIFDAIKGKITSIPINKQEKRESCFIFNVDTQWLLLYNLTDTTGNQPKAFSKVYRGFSQIFLDSSVVTPFYYNGFCYLFSTSYSIERKYFFKTWKIGKNSESSNPLPKKTSFLSNYDALMVPSGLKLIIHSNSGHFSEVNLFDLAGRLIFSGNIPNDQPFIIPSRKLPNRPFILDIDEMPADLLLNK